MSDLRDTSCINNNDGAAITWYCDIAVQTFRIFIIVLIILLYIVRE